MSQSKRGHPRGLVGRLYRRCAEIRATKGALQALQNFLGALGTAEEDKPAETIELDEIRDVYYALGSQSKPEKWGFVIDFESQ